MRILISSVLLAACQLQQPPSSPTSCASGETDTACGCLPAGDQCCPDGGYCDGGNTCVQYSGQTSWSCAKVSVVTISMSATSNGTAVCPNGEYLTLSPDPTSIRVGDLVKWMNTDSVAHTLYQYNGTAHPVIPLTTAPAGGESGDIFWSSAGDVQYEVGECNPTDQRFGNPLRLGGIVVTVG